MPGSLVEKLIKKHGGFENESASACTSLESFAEALARDEELSGLKVQEVFTSHKRGVPRLFIEVFVEVGGEQHTIFIESINMPNGIVSEYRAKLYSGSSIESISSLLPRDRYPVLNNVKEKIIHTINLLMDRQDKPLQRASSASVHPDSDPYIATRQPNGEWVYPQRMASSSDSPIVTRQQSLPATLHFDEFGNFVDRDPMAKLA